MAVTRPLKEGSVTTYQQKVALGFPDILASEADADLDTIYAAWNGGVATANLIDGSVTTAKIANLNVTTAKLADANVTAGKLAPGAAMWQRVAAQGPASGVTLTAPASPIYLWGVSITAVLSRPLLLFGNMYLQLSKITATAASTNVYVEYWIGGTATGRDGTQLVTVTQLFTLGVNGTGQTVPAPLITSYIPTASGALPFKAFGANADNTNYAVSCQTNSSFMNVVELS
jgi:hypothetical protein